MILLVDPVFHRQLQRFPPTTQVEILFACIQVPAAFASPKRHSGLGLRKIHVDGYWEIRVGLGLRVVLSLERDTCVFKMVGSHDDVRRFLRNL